MGYRSRILQDKETGVDYAMVQVHDSMFEGSVSKTGKSFVQRIKGVYVKANGEFIGEEGKLTSYISHPIAQAIKPVSPTKTYLPSDIVKFDFGNGFLLAAVKIIIHNENKRD